MRHEMVKLKDPQTLRRLWSRVLDPEEGIRLDTHRYYFRSYPDTFQGGRLVSWLVSQDSQTSRAQAVAIGQALLSSGLMSSVAGLEQFSEGTELYQPLARPDLQPSREEAANLSGGSAGLGVQEPAWLQDLPNYSSSSCEEASQATSQAVTDNVRPDGQLTTEDRESVSLIEVDIGELKESVVVDQVGSDETDVLDSVYRQHEAEYLDTLLKVEKIPELWRETIVCLAEKAVSTVVPSVRHHGDEMDILTYLKVKCVAGGQMSQCRLVEGEVCSLQLTHKDMENVILKPRIALVAESIMFKDRNAMVSLETVQLQEAEYVKNVIGKLLDLRPSLVLVEKSVTHLAQEILRKERVSLAVNVKPKVLSRLSRLIEGSIIKSVDTLMTAPTLGTCDLVTSECAGPDERLLLFEGCKPSLGGTILLRGGDRGFLSKVKAILRRLILIKYSWKHERSFLSNEYASLMDTNPSLANFDQNQLSISPFIKISKNDSEVPFALEATDMSDGPVPEPADRAKEATTTSFPKHPWCEDFLKMKVTSLSDSQFRERQALFRAAGWRLNHRGQRTVKHRQKFTVLLPEDHTEVLSVQFSMYSKQSRVAPNYCVFPWVVNMHLYSTLDLALGEFLESLCFSDDYVCPNKQCSTPPILHTRRFCHAGGAVTLHMQQLEAPIMGEDTNKLMMWKYCTSCEMITNIVPVSDDTWALSFSLFLHLLLHEAELVRRGASRPDATCSHSLHQEHLTCFGQGDQVVTFRYSTLQVWDIETSSDNLLIPSPTFTTHTQMKKLSDCKTGTSTVYDSILTRLHNSGEAAALMTGDQEREHQAYRERLERLEETINTDTSGSGVEVMSLLRLFQRDVMVSHQSWTKRLSLMTESAKKKTNGSSDPSSETKKTESDTTVKKLISTILPQAELSIPSPFEPETHMITHVKGVELDFPSPHFVDENKPTSMISYLLSSPSYHQYLATTDQPSDQPDSEHFTLEMSDATTKFYCCSYFTSQFHNLRQLILSDKSEVKFVQSLSDCCRWEAMGGKSGLLFYKTADDRFVIKQMSRFEYQSFLDFAPHYFQYLKQSVESGAKTLLGKIVGVYKVGFKNSVTGTGMNMEFLIMENLFFGKVVSRSYDLKGSVRNRLISEGDTQHGMVLLDENLLRVSCESPLYVNQQDKDILNEAIKRDAGFLASHQMMDYSLLAGICDNDNKLVVGIIDYIRTFTWDKKLET